MCSRGCMPMVSALDEMLPPSSSPNMVTGTSRKLIVILVSFSLRRLPLVRKNGTPFHLQVSMKTRIIPKVGTMDLTSHVAALKGFLEGGSLFRRRQELDRGNELHRFR